MRFWDSSGIVPLLVAEPTTAALRALLEDSSMVIVWALTPVEVTSALWRRVRSGDLDEKDALKAQEDLRQLERTWNVVVDIDAVGNRARRLLALHSLRGADALQLAAALVACEEQPARQPFVTLDDRLADIARREGFSVLPSILPT